MNSSMPAMDSVSARLSHSGSSSNEQRGDQEEEQKRLCSVVVPSMISREVKAVIGCMLRLPRASLAPPPTSLKILTS